MNSYKQALYTGIIRICANLAMVAALFFAMYQASRQISWPSEAVFCLFFFGITIPLWILAWVLTRYIRRVFPAPQESIVPIPHVGETLVRWTVQSSDSKKCMLYR